MNKNHSKPLGKGHKINDKTLTFPWGSWEIDQGGSKIMISALGEDLMSLMNNISWIQESNLLVHFFKN